MSEIPTEQVITADDPVCIPATPPPSLYSLPSSQFIYYAKGCRLCLIKDALTWDAHRALTIMTPCLVWYEISIAEGLKISWQNSDRAKVRRTRPPVWLAVSWNTEKRMGGLTTATRTEVSYSSGCCVFTTCTEESKRFFKVYITRLYFWSWKITARRGRSTRGEETNSYNW